MKKNMKLKTKLIVTGILVTIVPLMILSVVTFIGNKKMVKIAESSATELAFADIDHMAENIYGMCVNQEEFLQQHIDRSLSAAHEILLEGNKISESNEMVAWNAVNQYSKVPTHTELPKIMVNSQWLGQNNDINLESP